MKMKTFEEFVLEEGKGEEKSKSIKSEVKLKDLGVSPFVVTKKGPRKNLSTLIDAFLNSSEVPYGPKKLSKTGPDKTPGQQSGGLTRETLKKKGLYLVGGAVRDHILGTEANDYDLATDATMDEIRLILNHAGFAETAARTAVDDDVDNADPKNSGNLPKTSQSKRIFYIKGTDIDGEEFVMGAKINGEEFEIATFRRDSKGLSDGRTTRMEFTPNIEEDAERRDFTINSMYLPLTTSDGDNNKLLDFHGGLHHLKGNKVKFVGNPKDRLKEDELRLQRYARFAAQLGDEPDDEIMQAAQKFKGLPSLMPHEKDGRQRDRRGRIYDEFSKAMKKVKSGKIDVKKLMGIYSKLGLLDSSVFPGMKLNSIDNMHDESNMHLQIAWMLQGNDPQEVYDKLVDAKWPKSDAKRIKFLIGMMKFHPFINQDELHGMSQDFAKSGFSSGYVRGEKMGTPSHIERWGQMQGLDKQAIDAFLQHVSHGDIQATPENPEFSNLFTQDVYGKFKGNATIGNKKRELAHNRFKSLMNKKPMNGEG